MFNKNKEENEIDLLELLMVLLHRWWVLVICTVAAAAIGFAYSYFLITPMYESTTSVYIMNNKDSNSTITYSDTQLASTLTKDYEALITSRYVVETAIEQCGLDDTYDTLQERISVSNKTDTRIIDITVTDKDPEMAQYIADSVRQIAGSQITSVMNIEAVNVVDEANLPEEPSSPSIVKWTAIGAVVGFMLAAIVIIITVLLDDTIKSSEDVEKYLQWSTLALIPIMEDAGSVSHSGNGKSKKRKNEPVRSRNSGEQHERRERQPIVKKRSEVTDSFDEDEE